MPPQIDPLINQAYKLYCQIDALRVGEASKYWGARWGEPKPCLHRLTKICKRAWDRYERRCVKLS